MSRDVGDCPKQTAADLRCGLGEGHGGYCVARAAEALQWMKERLRVTPEQLLRDLLSSKTPEHLRASPALADAIRAELRARGLADG